VGDDPVRWKERFVEGLAPVAALRRLPRWLGVVCVALLSLWWGYSFAAAGRWSPLNAFGQGLVVALGFGLVLGSRCAGAVTGERERQTWDSLALTLLGSGMLMRGRLWGGIETLYPFLAAYGLPMLVLAAQTDVGAFFWLLFWLILTVPYMYFFGAAGLHASVFARTSWQALISMLATGFGRFLIPSLAAAMVLGGLAMIIPATFFLCGLLDIERRFPRLDLYLYLVFFCGFTAVFLIKVAEMLLQKAENELSADPRMELLVKQTR
jgi:hypothetical protein